MDTLANIWKNLPIDADLITFGILIISIVILMVMILKMDAKLRRFLVGNKSENLSDSLRAVDVSIKELETFRTELEAYLLTVEKRLKKSVQAVYTVRFNPFKGTGSGGNQSFATAILNEQRDGVVISSLYAREHVSLFSKPIKNGISEYELSDEEKEAVAGALSMIHG